MRQSREAEQRGRAGNSNPASWTSVSCSALPPSPPHCSELLVPHLPTSTALGGVSALRRISGDGAVACCFLQQPELSPKGLYPCPRLFASETPFSHCTMGKPLPGCLWVTGDQYLGKLVISVTSDASAAAGAGERDMRILPSQIPCLEPEATAEASGPL